MYTQPIFFNPNAWNFHNGVVVQPLTFANGTVNTQLLNQTMAKAEAAKDPIWKKIIEAVLTYGPAGVSLLQQAGVIKSQQGVVSGQYDAAAFKALTADSGGTVPPPPPRSANFLEQNFLVIILFIIALAFFYFSTRTNRKRR